MDFTELRLAIIYLVGYWSDSMGGRFSRSDVKEWSIDFERFCNQAWYGN